MMTRMPVTEPSSHGRGLDDDPATRSRLRHARAALRRSDSEELRVRLARRAGRCIHFLLGPQLGRPSPSRLQELELASAAANHPDASAKVASTAGFILGAPRHRPGGRGTGPGRSQFQVRRGLEIETSRTRRVESQY